LLSFGSGWAADWDRCTGAFPMGYLSVLLAVDWHTRYGTALTALCLTGIIGGYTTFSSMQMDAVKLAGTSRHVRAASYLGLSVVAGQLAAAAGGRARPRAGPRRSGVVNFVILVMVGGGLGAMLREFVMLMVPNPVDGFPLDILVANLLAALLLGLVTALHRRQVLSEDVYMLLGAGIMGGMSTFSSFVYGSVVLMHASITSAVVASVYVVFSLALGYLAIIVGDKLGGQARRPVAAVAGGGQ
jgi:fluoride exporter